MMKTLFRLLVILSVLIAAAPALADTFLVLGRAPLAGNEAAAKDAAVADALSRAVAQAAASSLDPVTLRGNLATLNQEVLSDAKRYITNYTLVASAPSGKSFLVLVSVTIDQRALTHSLIRAALKLPTSHMGAMLIMVSEEAAPGRPPVYWWSGQPGAPEAPAPLVKVIKRMGIRIINPQPLKALLTPDMRQPVLSEAQALEFARQAGAQVVLLGSVRTYPLVTPEQVTPPPLVQLLAIEARTGEVVAMEEAEGPTFHATPAASEYPKVLSQVEGAARNLMAKLAAKLAEVSPLSRKLTLKVSGVRSLGQVMRLEKALGGMTDLVDSLQRVSAGAGKATFSLTLKGPASRLADQLMVQKYGDFLVNVVEQDDKNMEVVIIPRQPGSGASAGAGQGGQPAGTTGQSGSGAVKDRWGTTATEKKQVPDRWGATAAEKKKKQVPDRWETGPAARQDQGTEEGDKTKKYPWEQGQGGQNGGQNAQDMKQQLKSGQMPNAQELKKKLKSGKVPNVEELKKKLKSGNVNDLLKLKQQLESGGASGGAPSGGSGGDSGGGSGPVKYPWEQ